MVVLLSASYGKFNSTKFLKKIRHADPSALRKTVKTIDASDVQDIAKNVKLNKMTPTDKLVTTAETISKKGKFADGMINNAKEPLTVVRQYSRYGQKYIETTETVTKKILGIPVYSKEIKKILPAEVKKVLPEKIKKILPVITENNIIDRYVKVLKHTGKKGFEISKDIADYAKRFPKSTAAGVLFAWFLADPNGFDEALEKSGGNVAHFAGTIAGTAVSAAVNIPLDAADKVGTSLANSIKNHLTFANILLIMILGGGYLGWKFRDKLSSHVSSLLDKRKRKKTDHFGSSDKEDKPLL